MQFGLESLGEWSEAVNSEIDAESIKAYAAATNDPIAVHLSGEQAPPVYAVVPVWGVMSTAMMGVVPADALMTVVHGEQDMRFHRQVTADMTLRSIASPIGVHVKPNGTTVVVRVDSRDVFDDSLVVEQYVTTFYRGITGGEGAGLVAPDHRLSDETMAADPVATFEQTIDTDQTFRYADASGDRMPIHLDVDFATKVGLPGIIVHGLCTMAFTSWAAIESVAAGDPTRLRRLAVRFSKPVLPGQTIVSTFWSAGEVEGAKVFGFETRTSDGDLVIKDGLVEVAN